MSELRFPAPSRRVYGQGVGWTVLGVLLLVWGIVVIAANPLNWAGAVFVIGGVFVGCLGLLVILLVWAIFALGTAAAWRNFRQLRPPDVVVDDFGVRYLASRRPVAIPWGDIERVGVERVIFPDRTISQVSVRLAPGAALLHDGRFTVPSDRALKVGLLAELAVPEDTAMRFLEEKAERRLEIKVDDRRVTAEGRARG
jgi:hypothetical protein